MSESIETTPPYKSRDAFLAHGINDILLDAALDCSICREPLAVAFGQAETAPPHLPSPAVSSFTHVAINDGMTQSNTCDFTITASTDDDLTPEKSVRILPCAHIFGRTCLSAWFTSSKSNRCPECNQELFPSRHMKLFLREPTRSMRIEFVNCIEEMCGDAETAQEIRDRLMKQGYDVEYQYVGGEEAEEVENEDMFDDEDDDSDEMETDGSEDDDEQEHNENGTLVKEA
ncbi:hypothetical protein BU25DRAFT_465942 [Macroventuria anomochaeta]|uniref:Uncharacterized protein n=1 Tax=Macroventuria anomochaeta TaxID=301207 RepID=A0ACB6S3W8_9PLEO|nr:uncharacterized protein BU25DRAFT_465942 [Macroventuria anomochaeta]KAF2628935.1 hypothetical protein BU25DRAFT_465942 [Macroventuria anomochaeta]